MTHSGNGVDHWIHEAKTSGSASRTFLWYRNLYSREGTQADAWDRIKALAKEHRLELTATEMSRDTKVTLTLKDPQEP